MLDAIKVILGKRIFMRELKRKQPSNIHAFQRISVLNVHFSEGITHRNSVQHCRQGKQLHLLEILNRGLKDKQVTKSRH